MPVKTEITLEQPKVNGSELKYRKLLVGMIEQLADEIKNRLAIYFPEKRPKADQKLDDTFSDIERVFDTIREEHAKDNGIVYIVGKDVIRRNDEDFLKQATKTIGINISANVPHFEENLSYWARSNSKMIKTVKRQYLDDIEKLVTSGFANGLSQSDVARMINKQTGTSMNNAKRIARTEVNKLNSAYTNERYEHLGVTKAIWVTNVDGRERACHKKLNGVEYDIKKGVNVSKYCSGESGWIFPGGDSRGALSSAGLVINCRCRSKAVVNVSELVK